MEISKYQIKEKIEKVLEVLNRHLLLGLKRSKIKCRHQHLNLFATFIIIIIVIVDMESNAFLDTKLPHFVKTEISAVNIDVNLCIKSSRILPEARE